MTDSRTITRVKPTTNLKEPGMYNVLYINDEVTSMEFVMNSLISVFRHSPEVAEEITMNVHTAGSAVVATLPFEMAEQKGVEVTQMARSNGFPLVIKLEPA